MELFWLIVALLVWSIWLFVRLHHAEQAADANAAKADHWRRAALFWKHNAEHLDPYLRIVPVTFPIDLPASDHPGRSKEETDRILAQIKARREHCTEETNRREAEFVEDLWRRPNADQSIADNE